MNVVDNDHQAAAKLIAWKASEQYPRQPDAANGAKLEAVGKSFRHPEACQERSNCHLDQSA